MRDALTGRSRTIDRSGLSLSRVVDMDAWKREQARREETARRKQDQHAETRALFEAARDGKMASVIWPRSASGDATQAP